MTSADLNVAMLKLAAHHLRQVRNDVVFIGGCAVGLLLTDPAAPPVRVTYDVDVLVEIASRCDHERLHMQLRNFGFREDTSEDAPNCRWRIGEIRIDIMPTDPRYLGFSNRWYRPAVRHAQSHALDSNMEIRLITPPYFLATKLEAFAGRGKNDLMASHDIEDMVAVIDGRPELVKEVRHAEPKLRRYIAKRFQSLQRHDQFDAALSGHMPNDPASQQRVPLLSARWQQIVAL